MLPAGQSSPSSTGWQLVCVGTRSAVMRCARVATRAARDRRRLLRAVRVAGVSVGDVGCRRFADQLLTIGAGEESVGDEVVHIARDRADIRAVCGVELVDRGLV